MSEPITEQEKDKLRISGQIHGQEAYIRALEAAQKELSTLLQDRQRIDDRIANLQRTIDGLHAVCEEQAVQIPTHLQKAAGLPTEDAAILGLTNAIRAVLSDHTTPMTPTEVRDGLIERGFNLDKYSNAMVAIHNTLKRLYDQCELARSKEEPIRYMWVSEYTRTMNIQDKVIRAMIPTRIPKDFMMK